MNEKHTHTKDIRLLEYSTGHCYKATRYLEDGIRKTVKV